MSNDIWVLILSLVGTAAGAFAGNWQTRKVVSYRIDQLEKKVDKHNSVVERMAVMERDSKTVFNRVDELREEIKDLRKRGA